jgi:hypothetical protein
MNPKRIVLMHNFANSSNKVGNFLIGFGIFYYFIQRKFYQKFYQHHLDIAENELVKESRMLTPEEFEDVKKRSNIKMKKEFNKNIFNFLETDSNVFNKKEGVYNDITELKNNLIFYKHPHARGKLKV